MTFKFVAKNLQTGKTGAVTVKADRETIARQKLQLSGYEVVRLMRVTNGQENSVKMVIHSANPAARAPRAFQRPSPRLVMKMKISALLHDVFAPFALFA
jgi:hypothetical protein